MFRRELLLKNPDRDSTFIVSNNPFDLVRPRRGRRLK